MKVLGKIIDWKDVYVAQRSRLKELFGEIEKEFQILWEENQERILFLFSLLIISVRRKLDEATNRSGGGTFSVLQRKLSSHGILFSNFPHSTQRSHQM